MTPRENQKVCGTHTARLSTCIYMYVDAYYMHVYTILNNIYITRITPSSMLTHTSHIPDYNTSRRTYYSTSLYIIIICSCPAAVWCICRTVRNFGSKQNAVFGSGPCYKCIRYIYPHVHTR